MHTVVPSHIKQLAVEQRRGQIPAFDDSLLPQHLRVALRCRAHEVEVSAFNSGQASNIGLCVIADDGPGLLAAISEALLLNGLDVVSAQIYTRKLPNDKVEAVDLFWVRPQGELATSAKSPADLARSVRDTLVEVLAGQRDNKRLNMSSLGVPTAQSPATFVRFIGDDSGTLSTLEVETADRSGLLLTITSVLSRNDVQIIASMVNTTGALVFDRFQLREQDGAPIGPKRRRQIQQALLAALGLVSFGPVAA
jgi:[protein-PII] uridylyltransferase